VIADSLGMHLDLFQRIQVDPCSLTVIRYTPLRPFLLRMNDTGGAVSGLVRPDRQAGEAGRAKGASDAVGGRQAAAGATGGGWHGDGDAVVGGGAGG
jgi:hypothetical protein